MNRTKATHSWWLRNRGRSLTPEELRAQFTGLAAAKWTAASLFDGKPMLRLEPPERERAV